MRTPSAVAAPTSVLADVNGDGALDILQASGKIGVAFNRLGQR